MRSDRGNSRRGNQGGRRLHSCHSHDRMVVTTRRIIPSKMALPFWGVKQAFMDAIERREDEMSSPVLSDYPKGNPSCLSETPVHALFLG